MIYPVLRWASRTALRWFYREVTVEGLERVPQGVPLLVVANHPNQLVDAMLVGTLLPRDVLFTGRANLLDNPAMAMLMRRLPFVPLRRAHDERAKLKAARGAPPRLQHATEPPIPQPQNPAVVTAVAPEPDPARNAASFAAIHDALADRSAVLIFPEGISHHQPQLAPIKTGAARIALSARDERGIPAVHVLPVGLNFEEKASARTRVLVRIGAPVALDGWAPPAGEHPVTALTAEIDAGLRDVTLNFERAEDRARVLHAAGLLGELFTPVARVDRAGAPLAVEHDVARRVERARRAAAHAAPALRERVERFAARLDAFGADLTRRDLPVEDLPIDTGTGAAAWFVVREGARMLAAAPLALWGRVNHELPLRLARALAARTSRTPEDPAMHTIVAGLATVLGFYALQGALVWALFGPWWALAYLATLPPSATWDLRMRDHMARARQRVRAYLALRREPALRARLLEEMAWLRAEAPAIEAALAEETSAEARPAALRA